MTPLAPPSPDGKRSSSALLIVGLVAGALGLVCCVGTLAAVAIPNFVGFNRRAYQSEAKSNLKAAYVAQKVLMQDRDTYSESIEEAGFQPEPGNRYRYFFSLNGDALVPKSTAGGRHTGVLADETRSPRPDNAALRAGLPVAVLSELGLKGQCPGSCRMVMAAVADLDRDATLDVWSISTEDRVIDGQKVPAGVPFNHVNDVEQ